VNKKGYLVDAEGNVLDKRGKKVFDNFAVSKDGEVPKIFPFSKFNAKQIEGAYELDPLGNPILSKNRAGQLVDSKGRPVNKRGYLVDREGNIIDQRGTKVFDRQLLEKDGDIPKVFRNGMLRRDTVDSISRLMSEIEDLERKQASDYENEYPNEEEEDEDESGGNTSVESGMEDTPSNYNIANQRFERDYYEVNEVIEDDPEDQKYDSQGNLIAPRRRMKKKHRKRKGRPPMPPQPIELDRD